MQWLEVRVDARTGGADALCAFLEDLGVSGLAIEDEKDLAEFIRDSRKYWDYIDEELLIARQGVCRVTFYLPDGDDGQAELARYSEALAKAGYPAPRVRLVGDEDWENNWKAYYKPMEIGKKLLLVPEWEAVPAHTGRVPLRLNPGLVFGTGAHPSTRMCLEAAEALAPGTARVLDLGCGSGILAIAALVLGAESALGCDIDEAAPHIAMENAAYNGVETRLEVLAGDALADPALRARIGSEAYGLIFMNIVADVVAALSRDVCAWLRPGGTLVCSGIIDGRENEVRAALTRAGLRVLSHTRMENWHAFTAGRDGGI